MWADWHNVQHGWETNETTDWQYQLGRFNLSSPIDSSQNWYPQLSDETKNHIQNILVSNWLSLDEVNELMAHTSFKIFILTEFWKKPDLTFKWLHAFRWAKSNKLDLHGISNFVQSVFWTKIILDYWAKINDGALIAGKSQWTLLTLASHVWEEIIKKMTQEKQLGLEEIILDIINDPQWVNFSEYSTRYWEHFLK